MVGFKIQGSEASSGSSQGLPHSSTGSAYIPAHIAGCIGNNSKKGFWLQRFVLPLPCGHVVEKFGSTALTINSITLQGYRAQSREEGDSRFKMGGQ